MKPRGTARAWLDPRYWHVPLVHVPLVHVTPLQQVSPIVPQS